MEPWKRFAAMALALPSYEGIYRRFVAHLNKIAIWQCVSNLVASGHEAFVQLGINVIRRTNDENWDQVDPEEPYSYAWDNPGLSSFAANTTPNLDELN